MPADEVGADLFRDLIRGWTRSRLECREVRKRTPQEVMFMLRDARSFVVVASIAAFVVAFSASPASAAGTPTCENVLGSGIVVHGQHIVGDYVTGLGAVFPPHELTWPPAGVGPAMQENHGAVLPGGPGPSFHFQEGLPPGASFCLEQAHPNGFTIPSHFG
jgi:hypothetical protein